MIDTATAAAFLGGIGAGSVVTALLQHHLSEKSKRAEAIRADQREVYVGLLHALEALELSNSIENKKKYGFWAARAQIAGSDKLVASLRIFGTTEPNSIGRNEAFNALLAAMREDLLK